MQRCFSNVVPLEQTGLILSQHAIMLVQDLVSRTVFEALQGEFPAIHTHSIAATASGLLTDNLSICFIEIYSISFRYTIKANRVPGEAIKTELTLWLVT